MLSTCSRAAAALNLCRAALGAPAASLGCKPFAAQYATEPASGQPKAPPTGPAAAPAAGPAPVAAAPPATAPVAPAKPTGPSDYALVIKQAMTLSADVVKPPPGELGMVSGMPREITKRKVRIVSPARTASQQGRQKTQFHRSAPTWTIEFPTEEKWINPLMGWTSTADPLENTSRASLRFYTAEQAAAFCEDVGLAYVIVEPNQPRFERQRRYMGYGDNFTVKRAGMPDLSHLPSERVKQASAAAGAAAKAK